MMEKGAMLCRMFPNFLRVYERTPCSFGLFRGQESVQEEVTAFELCSATR